MELVLPVPKDPSVNRDIINHTQRIVDTRAELRRTAHEVSLLVMGDREQAEEQEAPAEIV